MSIDLVRPELVGMTTYITTPTHGKTRLHLNESPWIPTEEFSVFLEPVFKVTVADQGQGILSAQRQNTLNVLDGASTEATKPFATSVDCENRFLNRYPDLEPQSQLEQALAEIYYVNPENLLLTRGADEGIDFIMRLFLQPGIDSIMQFPPAFLMYAFYARMQQANVICCPLKDTDFSLDLELLDQLWQPHCKLIMLCSPNNPTGNLIDLEMIASLCQKYERRAIIVVDEAYVEFAQNRYSNSTETVSATSLINSFDNLLVLRTLSKAYGLAGLRLGSVIGPAPLIQALRSITPPFTFSSLVIERALRVLKNASWIKTAVENIVMFREELQVSLRTFSWVEKVYPSEANFIFLKTKQAHSVSSWLEKNNILVRHYNGNPLLDDKLRITVGDRLQNEALLLALRSFQPDF
jgi:histidinol-phosphate aminotransferase